MANARATDHVGEPGSENEERGIPAVSAYRLRAPTGTWTNEDGSSAILARMGEAQHALARIRSEGATSEALEEYAACVRRIAGASLVVMFGRAGENEWRSAVPLLSEDDRAATFRAALHRADPEWTQSRLLRLDAVQAARVLARGDSEVMETVLVLPLRDALLGSDSAVVMGWDARRTGPSEQDALVLRALADQFAWALVAGTLAVARPSSSPPRPGEAATSAMSSGRDGLMNFVAHELRTPLTPIMMLLQSVERRAKSGQVDFAALARARRQALRLTRMIGDVVDLAVILDDRLVLDRTEFDIVALVAEVLDTFRPTMPKHRLEIATDGPLDQAGTPTAPATPATPAGQTSATVCADRVRIERTLSNLLEQIERQVPAGGVLKVSVSSECSEAQRFVRIRFSAVSEPRTDAPASSPPSSLKIEPPPPFPTLAQLRGANLGLYLATAMAKAHGGQLTIEPAGVYSAESVGLASVVLQLHLPVGTS